MSSPRESVAVKARRLLASGALTVTAIDGARITATCQGDHGIYLLGHHPRAVSRWWCGCEARSECSHVAALKLVVKP